MTATLSDTVFGYLVGWEGGYTNNPKDPGGKTKYGVIQAEYDPWRRKKGLPVQSVALITLAEAEQIYQEEYWTPTRCGDLDPGVADAMFDADVNSGDRRGVQWLQEAINQISGKPEIPVDGSCGDITVAAANALHSGNLIDAMLALRLAFMKIARNPKTGALLWPTFGKGWNARINGVRAQAHKLAGVDIAPASSIQPEPEQKAKTMTNTPSSPAVSIPLQQSNAVINPWLSGALNAISVIGTAMAAVGIDPHSLITTLSTGNVWAGLAVAILGQIAHNTVITGSNNATIKAIGAAVGEFLPNGPASA